jgi:hypothetical protein
MNLSNLISHYSTDRYYKIDSLKIGIIYRLVQFIILFYIVG